MTMKAVTFLALALAAGHASAQSLPMTDVWLATLENGQPAAPVMISDGSGYNNQPHFSASGRVIWYTREMPGQNGPQTDIAAFDIETSTTAMVTESQESEYSPTPMLVRNALSIVRVEADGKQRLWSVNLRTGDFELLFPNIEPVGYHAWVRDGLVSMFILGESFTLQQAGPGTNDPQLVAYNIGRSLRRHPLTGETLFVDKNPDPWRIAAHQSQTGDMRVVTDLFPGNEDFTVDSAGHYWTGNGSKLYKFAPGKDRWELVADFSAYGIRTISRLAVHMATGRIALVSD